MKKSVTLILAIIIVISAFTVTAAATDCSIKEYNISLSVPDDWYIISRDTPSDDKVFTDTGVDPDEFAARVADESLCLQLFDSTLDSQLLVSVKETEESKETFTLVGCTEEELTALADETLAQIEEDNYLKRRTGYGSYMRNGVYYMVMCYWEFAGDDLIHHQEFRTYYNGLECSVEMVSYGNKITQEESDVQSYIVNHLKFSKTLKNPNASAGETSSINNYIIAGVCAIGLIGLGISAVATGRKNKAKDAAKKAAEEKAEEVKPEETAEEVTEEAAESAEETAEEKTEE